MRLDGRSFADKLDYLQTHPHSVRGVHDGKAGNALHYRDSADASDTAAVRDVDAFDAHGLQDEQESESGLAVDHDRSRAFISPHDPHFTPPPEL